jgi:glycogen synthase
MRLLVYSPAFLPHIGGLEINIAHLAEELARRGWEVVVVTTTPGDGTEPLPFPVVRRPGPLVFLSWVRWCDVFYQANVSLRGLWPLLLVRRPWAVSHHSWYCRADGRVAWQDRLKRRLLSHAAASISVSRAIADDLGTPSILIPNAYRDDLFRVLPEVPRTRDLAFLGRLVSEKGCDLLLESLARLAARGLSPGLSIIGSGPEEPRLRDQVARSGIGGQVEFLGTRIGEELVRLLNQHCILVVPSRYNEPFGIVALEGIACGCVVVGSRGGGLAEAIGPCGRTFANGDVAGLTEILAELVGDPARHVRYREGTVRHLAEHASARVVERYMEVLAAAAPARRA